MRRLPFLAIAIAALAVAACSSAPIVGTADAPPPVMAAPPVQAPAPTPAYPTASPAVQAQVDAGRQTYARSCAACHGAAGEGGPQGPAVIGAGALPTAPRAGARSRRGSFSSAKDIGMFVMTSMPPAGPRLSPTDTAGILAFLLQSNGVTPPQAINPAAAGSIPWRR